MYTKETLTAINQSYDHIQDKDVMMANAYQSLIGASRSDFTPQAGDILEDMDGKYHHIDKVENEYMKRGNISLCESAMTSFISASTNDSRVKINLSTSGGPWSSLKIEGHNFTRIAKNTKTFKFFGIAGSRAGGAVRLQAEVNVWKLSEKPSELKS